MNHIDKIKGEEKKSLEKNSEVDENTDEFGRKINP